jgi:hypothetical protein
MSAPTRAPWARSLNCPWMRTSHPGMPRRQYSLSAPTLWQTAQSFALSPDATGAAHSVAPVRHFRRPVGMDWRPPSEAATFRACARGSVAGRRGVLDVETDLGPDGVGDLGRRLLGVVGIDLDCKAAVHLAGTTTAVMVSGDRHAGTGQGAPRPIGKPSANGDQPGRHDRTTLPNRGGGRVRPSVASVRHFRRPVGMDEVAATFRADHQDTCTGRIDETELRVAPHQPVSDEPVDLLALTIVRPHRHDLTVLANLRATSPKFSPDTLRDRGLVAVLDVFHPGLARGHLLVRRCQRDRSRPLVEPSLGSIAFLARVFEIVDRHV